MITVKPLLSVFRIRYMLSYLVVLLMTTGTAFVQQGNKRDQYPMLELKRVKSNYEKAVTEYERAKKGHGYGVVSDQDLNLKQIEMTNTEIEYQKSLLNLIFEEQYVTIVGGLKYQAKDGRKHVRITLENTSGGGSEYARELNLFEDKIFKTLQSDVIHNIYVSLKDDDKAIISNPYETKITQLYFGKPAEVDFTLLKDLDAVTVDLTYGNGSNRSSKISLIKDEKENKVVIQSEQFSQEALLGESANFDLTLELFSGQDDTFQLEVVNLPSELNRFFRDPSNDVRLSQFKFAEGNHTRKASLRVTLPDRPGSVIEIGKRIPFYALVIPRKKFEEMGATINGKIWTIKEIEALNVGYVRLELVPRGVGELVVRAQQLYFSILKTESIEIAVDLKNEGTRALDNIEIKVEPPLNWTKTIEPQIVRKLDVSNEQKVLIRVVPPRDISVGKYEIRMKSSGLSETQAVNGEDKIFTVEIRAETNVMGISIVVASILVLVLGIVIFGIRLSRR
jgi:hypothetical protein